MEDNDAHAAPAPGLNGWRFDKGYAEKLVPPPDVQTKGFPHVQMTAE